MSLVQQGIQTEKNKNRNIIINSVQYIFPPIAIRIWNNEAQALKSTCPA